MSCDERHLLSPLVCHDIVDTRTNWMLVLPWPGRNPGGVKESELAVEILPLALIHGQYGSADVLLEAVDDHTSKQLSNKEGQNHVGPEVQGRNIISLVSLRNPRPAIITSL